VKCRHCGNDLQLRFIDLGVAPPSNAFLSAHALDQPETWYPLRVNVCTDCWLVQTEAPAQLPSLFDAEYAYFSSYSITWVQHAERYVAMAAQRFSLGPSSLIIEIAANDGYLLQFAKARGIGAVGIEPAAGAAAAARAKGIEIIEEFFGVRVAKQMRDDGKVPDLMIANNVLAHVPDINDFVSGFSTLLGPRSVATFEFPHLLQLVRNNQFDTIYHEHFSYLSLTAVARVFKACGLAIFDVEELPTHGGSLRVYAQREDTGERAATGTVSRILALEEVEGVRTTGFYEGMQAHAEKSKNDFLAFLIQARRQNQSVAAYGAAAKGNTLLNFAGVRPDLIAFVVDRNPTKQGKFLPGSRIPVVPEARIGATRPDYIVILPWNLEEEIMAALAYARDWGCRFVTAIPELAIR
jgi:hypothetical protein